MSAGVEPETNCFLYHLCQCLSLNCFILVYKRSWNLCSVLFQFVFRNVSQANGILIFQYLRKNVMYAINGLKSFFAITLFNACMPYNIPIWRIRLYLKKIILTQFHMTLTCLKTRKLLLCLPKNNIKKYRI